MLLRPLVNRDENRLLYIRRSARGIGIENAVFSVPEIQDLRAGVKILSAFGDLSTIDFTKVGGWVSRAASLPAWWVARISMSWTASSFGPLARYAR